MKYFIELNIECGGCFYSIVDELLYNNIIKEVYFGSDTLYYFITDFNISKDKFIVLCINIIKENIYIGDKKIVNKITKLKDNEYLILKNKLKKYK